MLNRRTAALALAFASFAPLMGCSHEHSSLGTVSMAPSTTGPATAPFYKVPTKLGQTWPSEKKMIRDEKTGVMMTVLTAGLSSDSKPYQTHPAWTADGKWIVFRSSDRSSGPQLYAVNEATGLIVQLTEGAGVGTAPNVAQKSMKLYYERNATAAARGLPASGGGGGGGGAGRGEPQTIQMIEVDLAKLFADVESKTVKPAATYERICGTLPNGLQDSGGFGLDANEDYAYIGVKGGDTGTHLPAGTEVWKTPEGARMGAGPSGLRSMNLKTGEVKVIIDTPFLMGHVQTNPWVPGEIVYAYETGGDASQRMWTVKADGTGNRALFEEASFDWVTHETVVTKDEVMFNLIGHQPRLRLHPTGIAVINLRTNAMKVLGQVDEIGQDPNELPAANAVRGQSYGGFWHCNGSADGKWAVGDTFWGNVYLIDRSNDKLILLSTGHRMKPDHCHPTFNKESTKVLIQSGHWTDGKKLQLVVLPVPQS